MFESVLFPCVFKLWQRTRSVPRQLRLASACFTSIKCFATGLFKPPERSELRFVFPLKASLEGQLSTTTVVEHVILTFILIILTL